MSGDFIFAQQQRPVPLVRLDSALLQHAAAFSLDPIGRFYVIDSENNQLLLLNSDGNLLKRIGGYGWTVLSFDRPTDVSAQNGLDIYIADYGNHRIQHFDQTLNYISSLYFRDNERSAERFGYPSGIAISSQGDLFISDQENSRIVKVNRNATFDKAFGGLDAGSGRLQHPGKVRAGANGNVYVQDGNALKVFDIFGNYLRTIGAGMFDDLRSFQFEQDTLCVLDGCKVMFMNEEGAVGNVVDLSRISPGKEGCIIKDILTRNGTMFILTSYSILSMPIPEKEE